MFVICKHGYDASSHRHVALQFTWPPNAITLPHTHPRKQQPQPVLHHLLLPFACILLLLLSPAEAKRWPFSLGVRDSIMIAHSFKGSEFGPAQNVSAWHGVVCGFE